VTLYNNQDSVQSLEEIRIIQPQPERPPASRIHLDFRQMSASDLHEIMRIEKASFAYPWSTRFFLQELGVPCSRSLLAVTNGMTVGYIIYWLLATEVDIHNLAVDPSYRRQGIGHSLLQAVIDEAKKRRLSRVTLEVRKSNEAAQRLYRSAGFVIQGVRRGYYSDDGEDALAMALVLRG
jgi:ribosomal-protein-alanine N-acetyltransferase